MDRVSGELGRRVHRARRSIADERADARVVAQIDRIDRGPRADLERSRGVEDTAQPLRLVLDEVVTGLDDAERIGPSHAAPRSGE